MRFIQAWSYVCANHLMVQMNEKHVKRRVYYFGFQVIIGALVKGAVLVASALLLGALIPTLAILAVFVSIRVIAGGYHMNTYGKCIIVSAGLFLLAGCTVQYTYLFWGLEHVLPFVLLTFLTSLLLIIRYAPSDTPNRPITKPEEIKKFRMLSIIYVFIWLAVIITLTCFKLYMLVLSGCFGLLLESFVITPAAYKFFDRLSGKVDKIVNI